MATPRFTSQMEPFTLRTIASGAPAVVIGGPLRLSAPLTVTRPFALFGQGPGPHLVWAGNDPEARLAAILQVEAPHADDPTSFARDIWIEGIHALRERPETGLLLLLNAVNLRGLTIRNCTTRNMGLAVVKHRRGLNGNYLRTGKAALDRTAPPSDPAVVAGFSPSGFDDLNEDLTLLDNDVDNGVYQAPLLHKEFAQPLNVVIIVKTNLRTQAQAHVLLFSSDLTLAYASLVDYYGLRFQIEFNFRDAKQYWGLEDFMNVTPTGVTNAANLSLFMVNVAYRLQVDRRQHDPDDSILDLKADCRGYKYVEEMLQMLPEKPEPILLRQMLNKVACLGRIHAAQPSFSLS